MRRVKGALLRLALAALPLPLLWGAAETASRFSLWRAARADAVVRGSGGFELYAVGDSTAWGEPYGEEASIAALAARRLGGRLEGRPIRVVVLARPGGTTISQLFELRKAMSVRDRSVPAAVLIYCAHNDRTVFDTPPQPAAARLLGRLARHSFVLGDLYVLLERRGVIMPHSDLFGYEANLRAMMKTALDAGAVPILSASVSNQTDIDPRLYAGDGLTNERTLALLAQGEKLEAARPARAVDFYRDAAARYPRLAPYAKYRLGRAYRALGRYEDARRSFMEASEEDQGDNFGRATRPQNGIVRRLAQESGLPWVDAVSLFSDAAPHGLLGLNLFSDGHHPNMKGRLILGAGFARALSERYREPESASPESERAVCAGLGLDSRRLAAADVYSGKWWLYSAFRQLDPSVRLSGARRLFDAGLALDPDNFSGWLGRGLLEYEVARGWLADENELRWFRGHGFEVFVTDDYPSLSEAAFKELLDKMRRGGVSAATLEGIERTSSGSSGLLSRRGRAPARS